MTSYFMLRDFAGSAAAVAIFPLFICVPGFVLAWTLNLMNFRALNTLGRFMLSCSLSIAVVPALAYCVARLFLMSGVWVVFAGLWCGFVAILLFERRFTQDRVPWHGVSGTIFAAVLAGWGLVAVLSLVDLQIGDMLYVPVVSFDYSVRAAVTSAIGRSFPPETPFFSDGRGWPLRYHYFWMLVCSLVHQFGRPLIDARTAMIAGTAWCGAGLLCVVALYIRVFMRKLRARAIWLGLGLLGITGFDIVPILLVIIATKSPPQTVEWWNADQISAWISTMLWVPHHLAALVACMVGLLLVWTAPWEQFGWRNAASSLCAGIAFASAAGLSVYVTFGFSAVLLAWVAVSTIKGWRVHVLTILACGPSAAVFGIPYLVSLRTEASGGEGLAFAVRWLQPFGSAPWYVLVLLLPTYYFVELGFFGVVGAFWAHRRFRQSETLTKTELFLVTEVIVCLLLGSFVRSGVISSNDLGWRVMLPLQFALLLCAVDFADGQPAGWRWRREPVLMLALVAGIAGTAYEGVMQRFYTPLADAGYVRAPWWLAQDGKRTYSVRRTYDRLRSSLPENALVQHNPDIGFDDVLAGFYSERRVAAYSRTCSTVFGGDPRRCAQVVAELTPLFAGTATREQANAVCESLHISTIVLKDSDPGWTIRNNWFWTTGALVSEPFSRAVPCGKTSRANSDDRGLLLPVR